MKSMLTMATLAALVAVASPVASQTGQAPSTSREEGLAVRNPQGVPAENERLTTFAREAIGAKQIANLATDKHTPTGVALLADEISLTFGEINNRLSRIAEQRNIQLPNRMSEDAQAAMERLEDLNQEEFAAGFTSYVRETYPPMIDALQSLGEGAGGGDLAQLAREAVPEMRKQLEMASRMAGANFEGDVATTPENLRRAGPIERKDGGGTSPYEPGQGRTLGGGTGQGQQGQGQQDRTQ